MKPNWPSFALALSLSSFAAADGLPFNEAVTEFLAERPPRPQLDTSLRYFLPGSGIEADPYLPALSTLLPGGKDMEDVNELATSQDATQRSWAVAVVRAFQAVDDSHLFIALDSRSDWDREELLGQPRRRIDYFEGSKLVQSEVLYDARGRRTHESLFDQTGALRFERHYDYSGDGPFPTMITVSDGLGACLGHIDFSLNEKGWPLREDQSGADGQPFIQRTYGYDWNGFLAVFKETHFGSLIGQRIEFTRDARGRALERKAQGTDAFEPLWVTRWTWDGDQVSSRQEWFEGLPLHNHSMFPGTDPRRGIKYRLSFHPNSQGGIDKDFFFRRPQGPYADSFPDAHEDLRLSPEGWLTERIVYDKDNLLLSRAFYNWDSSGNLVSQEGWTDNIDRRAWSYTLDDHGNWIRRSPFAATGNEINDVQERHFDYDESKP